MNKGEEKIKVLIKEFKNKYYIYKGIKRFSIPVIEYISSGKSTILNYLLNLKKILQFSAFLKHFSQRLIHKSSYFSLLIFKLNSPFPYKFSIKNEDSNIFNNSILISSSFEFILFKQTLSSFLLLKIIIYHLLLLN